MRKLFLIPVLAILGALSFVGFAAADLPTPDAYTDGSTVTLEDQWDRAAPVAISINTDFWSWVAASLPLALAIGLPLLLVAMVYRRLAG